VAPSSFTPTYAEKPELEFKQKPATGCLQEPRSAMGCIWILGETGSNKTMKLKSLKRIL